MSKACVPLALAAALFVTAACPASANASVPESRGRVRIVLRGDLYPRKGLEASTVLDFEEILGNGRTLAASSLSLRDSETGAELSFRMAQDPEARHPSGSPRLKISWLAGDVKPLEDRSFDLCFKTVEPGAPGAWLALAQTFSPDVALLATGFEAADPDHPDRPPFFAPIGQDDASEKTVSLWTDETARTGSRSLQVSRGVGAGRGVPNNHPFWRTWPPAIEVRPGARYAVGVWLKTTKIASGGQGSITMIFLGEKQERLPPKESILVVRGPEKAHEWKHLFGSLIAPAGARYVILQLGVDLHGEVFFDDLSLREVPGAGLPQLETRIGAREEGNCPRP